MDKKVYKIHPTANSERTSVLPIPWQTLLADRLPALMRASLAGDEHVALVTLRRLIAGARELDPTFAASLETQVSSGELAGMSVRRTTIGQSQAAPRSQEGSLPLLRRSEVADAPLPILDENTMAVVESLLVEHRSAERLLRADLTPRCTVFLDGPPGVGKTALSLGLAAALGLPHYQVELSSLMSSLLGRTGQQLREVLDFARDHHVVLLLDEFDAIAKRRDDANELGELKRVVSVLLKELEQWSGPSIIVTATNYPELIDPAMIRRFQLHLSLPRPDAKQARRILERHLGQFPTLPGPVAELAADLLAGSSGSDIRQVAHQALRQWCLDPESDPTGTFLTVLADKVDGRPQRERFLRLAVKRLGRNHGSDVMYARLLRVSKATIHNDMQKVESHA